ncbi:CBS domain-containing protein [Microbacterium sp. W4I4]|uniref:CBS domain-containing protein n=1 Tax=Microbacterium sp. W4I4 TaxID=3042295 RepID=UPI002787D0F6|nr:CBS domain-containing protein [Microbacterium sp. W4I4]MDQ0615425.1 CBS domain-containing protein [Microbacterium sp. W4I4]
MTLTRDIMTAGAQCVGENDALTIAAELMRDLDVGALPICGEDGRLKGMLTDRDIVVKGIADGYDPDTTNAGRFAEGSPLTAQADDDIASVLELMREHQVRRVPVIDEQRLVGIVSQADIARSLDPDTTGDTVEHISREGQP